MPTENLSSLCVTAISKNRNLIEYLEGNSNYLPEELKEKLVAKMATNLLGSLNYAMNDIKNTPLIRYLIKNDPKYNEIEEVNKVFVLANKSRNLELVKLSIAKGANVNVVVYDYLDYTALHLAAKTNNLENLELARLLIERGANVNTPTRKSETALHTAARVGNLELARLLINARADIDATTADDETALHLAIECGNIELARLLIKSGANVNAARIENFELIRYLKNIKSQKICNIASSILAGIGAICTVGLGFYFQKN